ncbi:Small ubiquitin-like modifier 2 [Forsythia ovata]|uniref:Small ubiquitin-like modifier 2 n=1 Tax=Forsythia ovata TaxID=205694 RepID=A0ABD1PXM3_9LAMI
MSAFQLRIYQQIEYISVRKGIYGINAISYALFAYLNGESSVKVSTPCQEEDKKPGDQSVHINLKVKGHDGNEIAILFDGRCLRAEQTPNELEMEDGDEIDGMLIQTGGSGCLVRD